MSKPTITIAARVNAPLAKTWETFTRPEHIMRWCQASDDWHAPAATNDVRTGGTFSTTMAAKDGSFSFEFGGVYTDVKHEALLAYTIGDGRTVTVTFEEKDGGTEVVEVFEPEGQNPEEMQRSGWQAILDNFKKYTELH